MRVLCTVAFSAPHAMAALPLLSMLTELGHEVVVAGSASVLRDFAKEPIRTVSVFPEICDQLGDLLQGEMLALPSDYDPFADEMIIEFAAGPHITSTARTLQSIAEDFRPHIILRAGVEFAGMLVAEVLRIPHVATPSGVGQYMDRLTLLNALNERRMELRTPRHESLDSPNRYGRLDAVPPGYSFARQQMPPAFIYQQPAHHGVRELLPQWISNLDPEKPLIVAATSTSREIFARKSALRIFDFDAMPQQALGRSPAVHLATLVEGLSSMDCEAIVLTGGLPVEVQAASHVHLVESMPQALLLQASDLLVSHGGYNSIREAMRAGIPHVVLPVMHDQMHNAHRIDDLRLGAHVRSFQPGAVASACQYAMANPAVRQSVRMAQRRVLGLPPIRAVAGYLERIVHHNRRLTTAR